MLHDLILMPIASLILAASNPADVCKGFTADFAIYPVFNHVEVDHSLRAVDLASTDAWGTLKVDHMTSVNKFTAQSDFRVFKKNDILCSIMTNATIIYRMESTMRVSNPYPVNSCEYKQTQAHIQRHIDVARNFQKESTPLMQRFLQTIMKGQAGGMMEKARDQVAKQKLQKVLNDNLASYAKYLNEEQRLMQSKMVDNPEEMKKMFAACPGWKMPPILE